MPDILVSWNNTLGQGDWSIDNGDIVNTNSVDDGPLQSAILISLFTNLGSYWGDAYNQRPLGSKLHTLFRTAISNRNQTISLAQSYCTDALQWLIDDGIAQTVTATATFINPYSLGIGIIITKAAQGGTVTASYQVAWAKAA